MRRSRAAMHFHVRHPRPTQIAAGCSPGSLPQETQDLKKKKTKVKKENDGDNNEHKGEPTGHKGKIKVQTLKTIKHKESKEDDKDKFGTERTQRRTLRKTNSSREKHKGQHERRPKDSMREDTDNRRERKALLARCVLLFARRRHYRLHPDTMSRPRCVELSMWPRRVILPKN